MVLKVANWVMLAAFLFSVAVQYNDPDPIRWMLIYGLAALACILKLMGRLNWYLPAAVGARHLAGLLRWRPMSSARRPSARCFNRST